MAPVRGGGRGGSCDVVIKRRLSYDAGRRAALGQEAAAFHSEYLLEHGHVHGVWVAFQDSLTGEGWGPVPTLGAIRQAYRLEAKRKSAEQPVRLPRRARRGPGGGRKGVRNLGDEVWHWFVDEISTVLGRINSKMLLAQAEQCWADLLELHNLKVRRGTADANARPKLTKLDRVWVQRWRKKYGVTWRTVNLRYKVSAAKRKSRLRILWANTIRLRVCHKALFGLDLLRFVGLDQKPLWFNTSHSSKTLALRGSPKVAVKKNTAASRERFTVVMNCLSWAPTPLSWPWAPVVEGGDAAAGAAAEGPGGVRAAAAAGAAAPPGVGAGAAAGIAAGARAGAGVSK